MEEDKEVVVANTMATEVTKLDNNLCNRPKVGFKGEDAIMEEGTGKGRS